MNGRGMGVKVLAARRTRASFPLGGQVILPLEVLDLMMLVDKSDGKFALAGREPKGPEYVRREDKDLNIVPKPHRNSLHVVDFRVSPKVPAFWDFRCCALFAPNCALLSGPQIRQRNFEQASVAAKVIR